MPKFAREKTTTATAMPFCTFNDMNIFSLNVKSIPLNENIIEKLKDKQFKLGLLSVHAKEWIEYCDKKYGYHRLFDSTLYSFEIAVSKPDKKAYRTILQRLNSKPASKMWFLV